jgi:peptide/nickel transport system ATP-binding protein
VRGRHAAGRHAARRPARRSAAGPRAGGPLLEVTNLTVTIRGSRLRPGVTALRGVSLRVAAGETLGLVGESGAGKSTLAHAVLGLVPVTAGSIRFEGRELAGLNRRSRRGVSRDLQVVFQDPYSSLNPARTVGQALSEPLEVHERLSRAGRRERIAGMLELVGLPADAPRRYPAEFSGGQRQRIAIARALMLSPKLVICDEPVSALDLSIQAQILNLLAEVQRELSVSYLFVSHDLAVVRHLSSRIAVLRGGALVESGPAAQVCDRPAHPYTRALLAAVPSPDPALARRAPARPDTSRPSTARSDPLAAEGETQ